MEKFVKCINNDAYSKRLTTGKIYKVINFVDYFRILDDNNNLGSWDKERFVEVVHEPYFTNQEFDLISKTFVAKVSIQREMIQKAVNDRDYKTAKSLMDELEIYESLVGKCQ